MDPGGQLDMQQLLAAAQQMQSQLMNAQQELADAEVEGTAGGGLVTVVVNGQGELVDLTIDAAAIDPADPEETAQTIADLVLAAVRDAYDAASDLQQETMGPFAAGFGGAGEAGLPGFPGAARAGGRRAQPTPEPVNRDVEGDGGPEVYEGVVQDLIDELGLLPGVGPKGAQRIAFHLLSADPADVRRLAAVLLEVIERVKFCRICGNVAEEDECRICRDPRRDLSVICVVEEPKDVAAIEKIREFHGRYHVLGGAISPIDGVGPDDLRIKELMTRLADGAVTEIILATDPNLEGEATATYLARLIKPMGLRVTRPASGLPVGGELEYADEVTLGRAFEGRRLLDVCRPSGDPGGEEWRPLADRIAADARDFLDGLTAVARGEGAEETVPLLLLEVAQMMLAGAQLGASKDVILPSNWEPDVGADPDLDVLRTGLAHGLAGFDDYAEIFDPFADTQATPFRLSDDLAAVAADLIHGLKHHEAGR